MGPQGRAGPGGEWRRMRGGRPRRPSPEARRVRTRPRPRGPRNGSRRPGFGVARPQFGPPDEGGRAGDDRRSGVGVGRIWGVDVPENSPVVEDEEKSLDLLLRPQRDVAGQYATSGSAAAGQGRPHPSSNRLRTWSPGCEWEGPGSWSGREEGEIGERTEGRVRVAWHGGLGSTHVSSGRTTSDLEGRRNGLDWGRDPQALWKWSPEDPMWTLFRSPPY